MGRIPGGMTSRAGYMGGDVMDRIDCTRIEKVQLTTYSAKKNALS